MLTGFTGVDASGDRKMWCEPGRYRVRIDACRVVPSRSGDVFYIIEMEMLEVRQTDVPEKMKAGVHYAQMIKMNNDMGPINAKRFLLCALGLDPNDKDNQAEVTDEHANISIGTDQPFAGLEMELHCESIITKSGKPFTKHNWMPTDASQWATAGASNGALQ